MNIFNLNENNNNLLQNYEKNNKKKISDEKFNLYEKNLMKFSKNCEYHLFYLKSKNFYNVTADKIGDFIFFLNNLIKKQNFN